MTRSQQSLGYNKVWQARLASRHKRTKQLRHFMKRKIFLDVETTGLDPLTSQIVEIAIIDETGRCLLSTRYNLDSALHLQTDREIDAALSYNRLTREELALYRPIDKYDLSTIEAILTSAEVTIGHNINFDKAFLEVTSERVLGYNCFKSVKWECTMQMLAKSKGIKLTIAARAQNII